jgi:hypothetical protein
MKGTLYILIIVIALLCIYLISLPPVKEHFIITDLKEYLSVIDPTFKDIDIREASSSYTEDKSIIYLCLRDEKGQYYPMNTIIYVALHEIAHLINRNDFGHTPAFHKIFDKLLCQAASKGIYDPKKPHTSWYCGVDISGISMPQCNVDDL